MKPFLITLVSGLLFLSLAAGVAAETYESTDRRVSLLELYTSEGCSSCPPADRWLSRFTDDERLWEQIIPVAFHVDYWNYIGWQDRFSSERYSTRQRQYARANRISTVYTPGFILNGEEWRSFFGLRRLSLDNRPGAGILKAEVSDGNITASYNTSISTERKDYVLNIAVLGFDLQTEVSAGENNGRILKHDFAVLGFSTVPMERVASGYTVNTMLPDLSAPASRKAIAVWVSLEDDQVPLQATGGWMQSD